MEEALLVAIVFHDDLDLLMLISTNVFVTYLMPNPNQCFCNVSDAKPK
jgi:hypothetical protein